MSLLDYKRDDFSQNGEDCVVERILEIVEPTARFCCEFGAWDGEHFSNTRALILSGWSAVLIEADPVRFEQLTALYANRPDMRCVNATVGEDASLAEILGDAERLDFLCIDVDGLDYELLEGLTIPAPRVLCIEINAGHDPDAERLLPPRSPHEMSASPSARLLPPDANSATASSRTPVMPSSSTKTSAMKRDCLSARLRPVRRLPQPARPARQGLAVPC